MQANRPHEIEEFLFRPHEIEEYLFQRHSGFSYLLLFLCKIPYTYLSVRDKKNIPGKVRCQADLVFPFVEMSRLTHSEIRPAIGGLLLFSILFSFDDLSTCLQSRG